MTNDSVFLRPEYELRQRHSSKWLRFPADVLPMHVAEMDYEIAPSIKSLLIDFVTRSDLGYLGPIPAVGTAFAGFANRHWGWQPDPSQVRLATDVGVSSIEIMRSLGSPGDKVVINSPVYSEFYSWIREAKLEVFDVPLVEDLETWRLDVAAMETAFKSGVKFYLLCSPHNPMGRVHDADELSAVAELALQYGVTVISDEIHAPLTYGEHRFVPWLALSDAAREVGVTVTAASKSFNLAGLKASIFVTQSATMQNKMQQVTPALHWRSSILGAFAMVEAFENGDDWLKTALAANEGGRNLLTRLLSEKLPQVPYWVAQGGYLAWLDLTRLRFGDSPAKLILDEKRIAVVAGSDLGANYSQYVRINFATSHAAIEQTVTAIAELALDRQ